MYLLEPISVSSVYSSHIPVIFLLCFILLYYYNFEFSPWYSGFLLCPNVQFPTSLNYYSFIFLSFCIFVVDFRLFFPLFVWQQLHAAVDNLFCIVALTYFLCLPIHSVICILFSMLASLIFLSMYLLYYPYWGPLHRFPLIWLSVILLSSSHDLSQLCVLSWT